MVHSSVLPAYLYCLSMTYSVIAVRKQTWHWKKNKLLFLEHIFMDEAQYVHFVVSFIAYYNHCEISMGTAGDLVPIRRQEI